MVVISAARAQFLADRIRSPRKMRFMRFRHRRHALFFCTPNQTYGPHGLIVRMNGDTDRTDNAAIVNGTAPIPFFTRGKAVFTNGL